MVSQTIRYSASSRRATLDESLYTRCRSFHDPHGAPLSASGIDLRGRPNDQDFPKLAKELVFMGGSLAPQAPGDPEFANNPRHEFNFWFDPEAAHIVLQAPWKKIT